MILWRGKCLKNTIQNDIWWLRGDSIVELYFTNYVLSVEGKIEFPTLFANGNDWFSLFRLQFPTLFANGNDWFSLFRLHTFDLKLFTERWSQFSKLAVICRLWWPRNTKSFGRVWLGNYLCEIKKKFIKYYTRHGYQNDELTWKWTCSTYSHSVKTPHLKND